jgi:hypothetical protein
MGSLVRHAHNILALLDAVLLPKEVSVIHCKCRHKGKDKVTKGNKEADEAAKRAAMQEYTAGPLLWEGTLLPPERTQYQSEESKQASDQA